METHLTKQSIFKRIKEVVIDRLGVDNEEVKPEARLGDDLGADSLDVAELGNKLEEEFRIDITYEEAKQVITVQNLWDIICTKCNVT